MSLDLAVFFVGVLVGSVGAMVVLSLAQAAGKPMPPIKRFDDELPDDLYHFGGSSGDDDGPVKVKARIENGVLTNAQTIDFVVEGGGFMYTSDMLGADAPAPMEEERSD